MKKLLTLIILLCCLKASAQDLTKYYNQKKISYSLGIYSITCAVMGTVCRAGDNRTGMVMAYSLSAVSYAASMVVFFDSEKWLKRARITATPLSLKITF